MNKLTKIKEYLFNTTKYSGENKNIEEWYLKQTINFINNLDKKTVDEAIAEQLTCECTKDKICPKCEFENDKLIRKSLYNFISWYNAKPKVKKDIDGLITIDIVEEYLK